MSESTAESDVIGSLIARMWPERVGTPSVRVFRIAALAAGLAMTASYVLALYHVADVVQVSRRFTAIVLATLVAATVLARVLRPLPALITGVILLGAGAYWYLSAVPEDMRLVLSVGAIVEDSLVMLSGLSILRLAAVGTWVTAFTPAPVFLSWYLAVRGRYVWAGTVGGLALSILVLTGDADRVLALVGAVGIAGMVGFGEFDGYGAAVGQADLLAFVLAVMVVGGLAVGTIPIGDVGNPGTGIGSSGGGIASLDGAVVDADREMDIAGAVTLSPQVRYTIESDEPAYWRTDGYDRYTGDSWVRTGDSRPSDALAPRTGQTRSVTQIVEVESSVADMPAVWRPVEIPEPPPGELSVGPELGIRPDGELAAGDRYVVVSERPDADPDDLRRAGTRYPSIVEDRYTQLPDRTPDRIGAYTERLTADADTPYDTARTIEAHLRETKAYSLDVDRPEGDVADAFLFEMEAGYCTYFATTMAVMLRTQGIPARVATGYSTGDRVDEDRWVVRGLDAHAWVEVYFPEIGWVSFEPTPPQSRDGVHDDRLAQARLNDEPGVDTPESDPASNPIVDNGSDDVDPIGGGSLDPIDDNGSPDDPVNGSVDSNGTPGAGSDGAVGSIAARLRDRLPDPTPEAIGLWLTIALGAIAGGHRLRAVDRLRASLATARPGSAGDPSDRAERAYRRLESHLSRNFRDRRAGETARTYVESCIDSGADERARSILRAYERARFGGDVDEPTADRAVAAAEGVTSSRFLSR